MAVEDRYSRHQLIAGWNQERISRGRVVVAGAGAIGNEVIKLLALVGVGQIAIIDFDQVEVSNLSRSLLFREIDIGRPKAEVAAERVRELNPQILVHPICGDLEFDIGLGVIRAADVVIGCLDSLNARLVLNRACLRTGTPWINGGIEVSVGEITLIHSCASPCYECGMSDDMWRRLGERFSCGGMRASAPETVAPTTAVVASLTAGFLVHEALHVIHADDCGSKAGLRCGQKITLNLDPYDVDVFTLSTNSECLAHCQTIDPEIRKEVPDSTTVRDMLDWAESPDGIVELGFDLLTSLDCVLCGESEFICRPVGQCDDKMVYCRTCDAETRALTTVNWIDSENPLAQVPLSEMSVPDHQVLSVNSSGERRYFQLGGAPIWQD